MKYSREDAQCVIDMFEKFLERQITIKDYRNEEFFHIYEIAPISICGATKSQIKFKDSLIDDCYATKGNLLDIAEFVKVCFV